MGKQDSCEMQQEASANPETQMGSKDDELGVTVNKGATDIEDKEDADEVEVPPESPKSQASACFCACCSCLWNTFRSVPFASLSWFLLYLGSFIVYTHGVESIMEDFSEVFPEILVDLGRTYIALLHICTIPMLILAVLSTGWIGEAVVRISLDADTTETFKCQCCLRCVAKCIWCVGAAGHWLVLVLTYLLIIFAIVIVIIAVLLLVFVTLLDAVCGFANAGADTLCPVLKAFPYGTTDAFDHYCSCTGTIQGRNCVGGTWQATLELTLGCGKSSGAVDNSVEALIGSMLLILALVGLYAVSLRNRQRMGSIKEAMVLAMEEAEQKKAQEDEQNGL